LRERLVHHDEATTELLSRARCCGSDIRRFEPAAGHDWNAEGAEETDIHAVEPY
jgi:hypothetical protein